MDTQKISAALAAFAVLLAVPAVDANAGSMWFSNRDRGLAINAWGGAQSGTVLRLHNGCRPGNPDCTWTFSRGMLISDRDPRLAIGIDGPIQSGTELRLRSCGPDDSRCLWDYRDGMLVSRAYPRFKINAWGGARYGTVLRLSNECQPDNPDCTWSR